MQQWKRKKSPPPKVSWGLHAMRYSFNYTALTTCGAPLPPGKKYIAVRYLSQELIFFVIDVKGKVQEVFEDSCKYLGLQDTELFGLAVFQDDEYVFIDQCVKLSKFAGKSWKSSNYGLGSDGLPLLVLYMRVKHYVDCHLLISEKVARHHYYLQIKENVKTYSQTISEEKSFLLAALALQADLGNYCPQRHKERYFEIQNYFPSWIVSKIGGGYIERNMPSLHKDNVGLSRAEAQVNYIKEASESTAPHNLHFYKMRYKKGRTWHSVWLGIKDSGIHIYEMGSGKLKRLLSTFLWCDIATLHFEKKKFEIHSEGSREFRKFIYYVASEDLAKNLLLLCRSFHCFHMSNEARVQDLQKLQLDGGKPYRESYIYTDEIDLAREEKQNPVLRKVSRRTKVIDESENSGKKNSELYSNSHKKLEGLTVKHHPAKGRRNEGMYVIKNNSMEMLPLSNGCTLSSDVKGKSQSLACFPDRLLAPCPSFLPVRGSSPVWSSNGNHSFSTNATSTLLSHQSSCASYTDSACSSLSLTSGTTVKALDMNSSVISQSHFNNSSQWVKCDSFEELNVDCAIVETRSLPPKMCLSTFKDCHVRTASLYNAPVIGQKTKHQDSTDSGKFSFSSPMPEYLISLPPSVQNDTCANTTAKLSQISDQQIPTSAELLLHQRTQNVYNSNKEVSTSAYGRTTTRIGISSLNRDQRLPLTLFNGRGNIMACGSEPNLYNMADCDTKLPSIYFENADRFKQKGIRTGKPNSNSELCLTIIGNQSIDWITHNVEYNLIDSGNIGASSKFKNGIVPDRISSGSSNIELDFPCIPPPPAYRNSSDIGQQLISCLSKSVPSICSPKEKSRAHPLPRSASDAHRELRGSLFSPPTDALDLQKLRQRSQDLDLPLISALCNDRSLLMPPKTVPTCSRQRHLGNKDPTRFAHSIFSTSRSGVADARTVSNRPVSWHVDSSAAEPIRNGTLHNQSAENRSQCWEGPGIERNKNDATIMTSFGRILEKGCSFTNDGNSKKKDQQLAVNKIQLIPTKLLSGNL